MKALQLVAWKTKPELREVADPDPGPGQVLVMVAVAGASHSDLHVMNEFEPGLLPYELPFTLGHETAGYVEARGDGVEEGYGSEVGAPVAVYGPWGAGTARAAGRVWRTTAGTAVDFDPTKLAPAEKVGADHTVQAGDHAAEEIRRISGGFGCELVIDCGGAQATVHLAVAVARPLSDITVVGIGGGTLGVGFFTIPFEASVATTYWAASASWPR